MKFRSCSYQWCTFTSDTVDKSTNHYFEELKKSTFFTEDVIKQIVEHANMYAWVNIIKKKSVAIRKMDSGRKQMWLRSSNLSP